MKGRPVMSHVTYVISPWIEDQGLISPIDLWRDSQSECVCGPFYINKVPYEATYHILQLANRLTQISRLPQSRGMFFIRQIQEALVHIQIPHCT